MYRGASGGAAGGALLGGQAQRLLPRSQPQTYTTTANHHGVVVLPNVPDGIEEEENDSRFNPESGNISELNMQQQHSPKRKSDANSDCDGPSLNLQFGGPGDSGCLDINTGKLLVVKKISSMDSEAPLTLQKAPSSPFVERYIGEFSRTQRHTRLLKRSECVFTLRDVIDMCANGCVEELIRIYLRQIVRGLQHLYSVGYSYGMLDSNNIIIDKRGKVILSDLSSLVPVRGNNISPVCIEIGCLTIEMLTGMTQQISREVASMEHKILEVDCNGGNQTQRAHARYGTMLEKMSPSLKAFVQQCFDPKGVDDDLCGLLLHPFLSGESQIAKNLDRRRSQVSVSSSNREQVSSSVPWNSEARISNVMHSSVGEISSSGTSEYFRSSASKFPCRHDNWTESVRNELY